CPTFSPYTTLFRSSSLIGSAWPVTGRTRSRSPWRGSGEEATLDRPDPEPGPAARDTGRRGQCGVGAERAGPAAAPGGGATPHHRTAPVRRRRRLVREPVRAAQPPQGDTGADRPAGRGPACPRQAHGRGALDVPLHL